MSKRVLEEEAKEGCDSGRRGGGKEGMDTQDVCLIFPFRLELR